MDANGNAKRSVLRKTFTDRALGRFIDFELPFSDATSSQVDLAGDLWQALWKRKPELDDPAIIDPMRGLNRAILDKYMSEKAFEQARVSVSGSLPASIACSQVTWAAITRDDYLKSAMEEQKEADRTEQQADNLDQQADDLDNQADNHDQQNQPDDDGDDEGDGDGSGQGDDESDDDSDGQSDQPDDEGDGEGDQPNDGDGDEESDQESGGQGKPQSDQESDAMREKAEKLRQKAEQLRQKAQEMAQSAADKLEKRLEKPMGKAAIMNAAEEGQKEAEEVKEFMSTWGMDGEDVHSEDADDILDFKRSAGELTDMVGRVNGIASQQIERVKNQSVGAASEACYTKDIFHLFPSELMAIMPGSPDIIRLQKINSLFAGAGLLGMKPKIEGEKEGNCIFMTDFSGSTWSGNPMCLTVEKSVVLGMATALMEQAERRWEAYYFDHESPELYPSISWESDWRSVMEWSQMEPRGGTDFSKALMFASKRIRELATKGEAGYDIVFLTDEDSYINDAAYEDFKKLKAENGCRLHVVSINCSTGGNKRLRELADTHITTAAITDDAGKITELIIDKIAKSAFGTD